MFCAALPAVAAGLAPAEAHHLKYEGSPPFTATNLRRHFAVIFPFASSVASIVARSSEDSATRARRCSGTPIGVGRFSVT